MRKYFALMLLLASASLADVGVVQQSFECSGENDVSRLQDFLDAREAFVESVYVTGRCEGLLVLTRDVYLIGDGSTELYGGSGVEEGSHWYGTVTVDHARVILENLNIVGGADGVTCIRGAACVLRNVAISKAGDEAVHVSENSSVETENVHFSGSSGSGLVVFNNSSALIRGKFTSTGNGVGGFGSGIDVYGASSVVALDDVEVSVTGNSAYGIYVVGSSLGLGKNGGKIVSDKNGISGMALADGAQVLLSGSQFKATGNKIAGVSMDRRSILNSYYTSIHASGGAVGVHLSNSDMEISSINTSGNATGVFMDKGARLSTSKESKLGDISCVQSEVRIGEDVSC